MGSRQPAYSPPAPEERPGIFSGGGGFGSFLRNAGMAVAGVADGDMLFSGLPDMFGHHGGGFFGGVQGLMGGPENVTINNYGGDDDRDDRGDEGRTTLDWTIADC